MQFPATSYVGALPGSVGPVPHFITRRQAVAAEVNLLALQEACIEVLRTNYLPIAGWEVGADSAAALEMLRSRAIRVGHLPLHKIT